MQAESAPSQQLAHVGTSTAESRQNAELRQDENTPTPRLHNGRFQTNKVTSTVYLTRLRLLHIILDSISSRFVAHALVR